MNCLNCDTKTVNPKFCSRSCAAQYNNTRFPKREKRKFFCEKCGAEAPDRRRFCDECTPQNGADWTTRTLAFVRSMLDYHARIRQLARKTYSESNRPQKFVNCGYSKHLETCHIKPIQEFSDDTPITVVNSLDNLVALCPNCHWELDHGLLSFDNAGRKRK